MKPRILLAPDRLGWAFGNIADALVRGLGDEFDFHVAPYPEALTRDPPPAGPWDVVVAFWWGSADMLRAVTGARRVVLGLYDGYSWDRTGCDAFARAALRADVIAVANEPMARDVARFAVRPVVITEDGVDCDRFAPSPLPEAFRVGWAGNSYASKTAGGCDDLKGVRMIREACALAGVDLVIQDVATDPPIAHEAMPAWYAGLSAYVCASQSEGTPNPALEAMACGRPVVTTDVGLVRRVVAHGATGLVCERSVGALAEALATLRGVSRNRLASMGSLARIAAESYDWRLRMPAWRLALRTALHA